MASPTKTPDAPAPASDEKPADTTAGKGDLVVLRDGFVARTNAKNNSTRRYGIGDKFTPVDDVHDVDELVKAEVLGYVNDKPRRTTALRASQAQAVLNQENSPVIDLDSTPFEQPKGMSDEQAEFERNSRVSQHGSTTAGVRAKSQTGDVRPLDDLAPSDSDPVVPTS